MINTKTADQYEQVWCDSIPEHIRFTSYAIFKHVRFLEPYIIHKLRTC